MQGCVTRISKLAALMLSRSRGCVSPLVGTIGIVHAMIQPVPLLALSINMSYDFHVASFTIEVTL
jgi:hypothetical protein